MIKKLKKLLHTESEWIYFSTHHRVSKKTGVRQIAKTDLMKYNILEAFENYIGSDRQNKTYFYIWGWMDTPKTIEELKAEAMEFIVLVSERREGWLKTQHINQDKEDKRRSEALSEIKKEL